MAMTGINESDSDPQKAKVHRIMQLLAKILINEIKLQVVHVSAEYGFGKMLRFVDACACAGACAMRRSPQILAIIYSPSLNLRARFRRSCFAQMPCVLVHEACGHTKD